MKNIKIEGIVLSRINYGEADRILTIFSKEEGKVKVLAKGSRKIKSKMAPHVEPFSVGNYFLVEGKTFYILTGAESENQNDKLINDLEIYQDASYVAELLSMTLPENMPSEKLYNVTKEIFEHLPKYTNEEREIILRFFEYKLLESAGYTPNFRNCVNCGNEIKETAQYYGGFEGVKCQDCEKTGKKISKTAVKIMRLFSESELSEVLKIKGLSSYNNEISELQIPFLYDILPRTPKAKEI